MIDNVPAETRREGPVNSAELRALEVLIAVDREGGFAAAARRLGVTRAAVSRSIAELEARLGARLARRTTRKVVLTEAATALIARCAAPLSAVASALDATREESASLAGTVRVAGPTAFGRDVLVPALLAFREAHPDVSVDLALADRLEDLVAKPIDVTVRMGALDEPSLIARAVGALPLALVVQAPLLSARPAPRSVDDLASWPAVAFRVPRSGGRFPWPFRVRGELRLWDPPRVAFESDSIDAVAELARRGAGLAVVPRHLVERDLEAGRLVALLEAQIAAGPPVSVCHVQRAHMPRRVRTLIDFLVDVLPRSLGGAGAALRLTSRASPRRRARPSRSGRRTGGPR